MTRPKRGGLSRRSQHDLTSDLIPFRANHVNEGSTPDTAADLSSEHSGSPALMPDPAVSGSPPESSMVAAASSPNVAAPPSLPAVTWKPTASGLTAYLPDGRSVYVDRDSELSRRALAGQWPLAEMVDAINQAYDAKPHLLVEYLINNPQVFWQLVSDGQTFEAYEAKSHPRPYWPPTVVVFALLRCCLYLVVVAAMAYIATLDAVPHAGSITAVVLTEPSHFHVNIMQDVLLGMHQFARTILGYTGIPVDNAIVVGLTGVGSLGACAGSFSLERAWERSRSRIGEEDWARLAVVLARWRTDEDLWLNCDEQPTPLASLPNTVSGADLDVTPGAGGTPGGTAESSSRERRIAEVHAAVTHLDAEWLAYTLDTNAYFLAKPILRDPSVPQTAAYLDALYELRELANQLESTAEETQIAAAHDAADRALYAWDAANDHAAKVGVSDRSPIERAALRRLPKLIARLADPGTARAEWGLIKAAIDNELAHLVTVPAKWENIAKLPEIEASRQLLALEQALPRENPL